MEELLPDFQASTSHLSLSQTASSPANGSEALGEFPPLLAVRLARASTLLLQLCLPLVIASGVFGNIMTLLIVQRFRRKGERSSIDGYLQALAGLDLVVVVTGATPVWLDAAVALSLTDLHAALCKLLTFLANAASAGAAWVLVVMTTHRAASVVWPHRVAVVCTARRSARGIAAVTALCGLAYSHILYGMDLDPAGACSFCDRNYYRFMNDVWAKVSIMTSSILPFACLLFSNAVLIYRLKEAMRLETSCVIIVSGCDSQRAKRSRRMNSVTVTAIAVSLSFIFLTLPLGVQNVLFFVYTKDATAYSVEAAALKAFLQVVFSVVAVSNHSVNFYLYCLTGSRFRRQFRAVFCSDASLVRCAQQRSAGSLPGSAADTDIDTAVSHRHGSVVDTVFVKQFLPAKLTS